MQIHRMAARRRCSHRFCALWRAHADRRRAGASARVLRSPQRPTVAAQRLRSQKCALVMRAPKRPALRSAGCDRGSCGHGRCRAASKDRAAFVCASSPSGIALPDACLGITPVSWRQGLRGTNVVRLRARWCEAQIFPSLLKWSTSETGILRLTWLKAAHIRVCAARVRSSTLGSMQLSACHSWTPARCGYSQGHAGPVALSASGGHDTAGVVCRFSPLTGGLAHLAA